MDGSRYDRVDVEVGFELHRSSIIIQWWRDVEYV